MIRVLMLHLIIMDGHRHLFPAINQYELTLAEHMSAINLINSIIYIYWLYSAAVLVYYINVSNVYLCTLTGV